MGNTGQYNRIITISTLATSESGGDVTEKWSEPVSVRASVEQVDGSRYLKEEELVDKAVYKIKCWDNSYSVNIRIVYNTLTMYPVRPIKINPGSGSKLNEAEIICAVKK
jgi:head-tail adaptor